jgi:hypothetical protein
VRQRVPLNKILACALDCFALRIGLGFVIQRRVAQRIGERERLSISCTVRRRYLIEDAVEMVLAKVQGAALSVVG